MRGVFDTNVIISAVISRSTAPPARILAYWRDRQFDLLISESILQEYSRALRYPHIQKQHTRTPAELDTFLKQFRQLAIMVAPTEEVTIVKQDPDDNKFLACALAGHAEYLVSGDRDLLRIGEYRGIHILTPKAFFTLLEQEKQAA